MFSEEVIKLNIALRYCDQLKNNLQASIHHVAMLNRKYNTTDYTNIFGTSIEESPRTNRSSLQQRNDQPRPRPVKRKQQVRSINDIKHNFNNIIVNGIKLRREVEKTTTKLKLLRNDNRMESSPYVNRRRIESPNDSSSQSPSFGCRHGRCFQNSSDRSGRLDQSAIVSTKKGSHSKSMPSTSSQWKRSMESFENKLTVTNVAEQSAVKQRTRFESTPIKINEPTSTTNRSLCSLNDSVVINNDVSQFFIDDDMCSPINAPIKSCFRNTSSFNTSLCASPKRICWTPIVKVRRISVYQ